MLSDQPSPSLVRGRYPSVYENYPDGAVNYIATSAPTLPGDQLELGMSLIEKMSSADFEPNRYADEYRERALAMMGEKRGRSGNQSRPAGQA